MREMKALKKLRERSKAQAESIAAFTQRLNSSKVLVNAELRVQKRRVHGKRAKQANFDFQLVVRGTKGMRCGQQYILGWGSMLKISDLGPLSTS